MATLLAPELLLFFYYNSGSEIAAGTFVNSLAVYPKIRIGKMTPYFNGIISQYSTTAKNKNNVQVYIIIQPAIIISASNGLLQSNNKIEVIKMKQQNQMIYPELSFCLVHQQYLQ